MGWDGWDGMDGMDGWDGSPGGPRYRAPTVLIIIRRVHKIKKLSETPGTVPIVAKLCMIA